MGKGYERALAYRGWHEIHRRKDLIRLFESQGIDCDPARIPWCAAFVNVCEKMAGNPGTGKLNARSFLTYGTPVEEDDAQEGDIIIFKRGNQGWQA